MVSKPLFLSDGGVNLNKDFESHKTVNATLLDKSHISKAWKRC